MRKKSILGLSVAAVAVLVGMSAAWACTFQPRIFALSQEAGPKGSEVLITGQGVAPQGAVGIHWNGVTGPRLAQTSADSAGNFSVVAPIPNVAPDVYSLVAVAANAGVARSSFEVTPEYAMSQTVSAVQTPPVAVDRGQEGSRFWANPSHAPGLDNSTPASSNSPNSGLLAGVGLLAAGLVALFSGFTIAVVRKRRALASAE
jgi:hypothetical protein